MAKISVKNLDLYYSDFKALKNVNLDIEENKITAFIGPSGCGKSTLLKSLNRMNDLVEGCRIEGEILLDGEDIYGDIDVNHLRKRVGMVFQKPNPFPMSIYDNIAYGPRTHGIRSKAKLDEIVEKCECAKELRGKGFMQGIVVDKPVGDVVAKAMEKGLVVISAGSDVVRMLPPLVIEKEHIDKMTDILISVLA